MEDLPGKHAAIEIKVFIAAQFEIGEPGDGEAGEFQHWYLHYFKDAKSYYVPGAESPLWVTDDGVAGAILGMGKVRSSLSMQALLFDPRFDFSHSYFLITGCAGTSPKVETVTSVIWADAIVDYDLVLRLDNRDLRAGESECILYKGFEDPRLIRINKELLSLALELSGEVKLQNSREAQLYCNRYPYPAALSKPRIGVGTHVTGDSFFHGPHFSRQAQEVCVLNNVGPYAISEMEGVAVAYVLKKFGYGERTLALRSPVNFDQAEPGASHFQHVHATDGGSFSGGFAAGIENIFRVGLPVVEEICANWLIWKKRF